MKVTNRWRQFLHYTSFQQDLFTPQCHSFTHKQIRVVFGRLKWTIGNDKLATVIFQAFYHSITRAACQQLHIFSHTTIQFVTKQISRPLYSSLTQIKIKFTDINTLEWISFLNISQDFSIQIQSTKISNLKILNKFNPATLKNLKIINNKISSLSLNRIKMLNESEQVRIRQGFIHPDVSVLVKSEFNLINRLSFFTNCYINKSEYVVDQTTIFFQNQVIRALKQKHSPRNQVQQFIQRVFPPKQHF